MAQFFNNELLVAPQTAVAIDDTAIGPATSSAQVVNVGLVGLATKGRPDVPVLVGSIDEAVRVFGQGPLVDAMRRVFAPAAGKGAQQVYGIRLNPATQGTVTLLDAATNAAVSLTTLDYGIYTRTLSVAVAAASGAGANNVPTGALKVTVSSTGTVNSPQADNLGYNVLKVEAFGSGTNTVSVNKWTGTVSSTTNGGSVASVVVDSGGAGYTSPPTVTFSAPQTPGGVTATGTAAESGGVVTGVTVTVPGSGYTSAPTVSFSGGGFTTVATAHAIANAPATSIQVTTSAAGQTTHQLVNQQVVITNSDTTQPFTTLVTAESGGTITVSPGDPFPRATTATVVGASVALLLTATGTANQAGLPLVTFGTVQDLATAASAVGTNWAVTVASPVNAVPGATGTVGALASPTILDVGQLVTVPQTTDPVNNPIRVTLTGIAQAVVDWLNGRADPYFSAVRTSAGTIPAATAGRFAVGGADDAHGGSLLSGTALVITTTDWNNALTALGTVDTPLFVLLSGDPVIIAMGDAHAVSMSTTGRLERLQIAGQTLGHSTADAIAEAAKVDSFRTYLVYPGIRDFDANGNLTTLEPFMAAAQAAGLAASLPENVALTGKALKIQGLEIRSQSNGGPFGPADVDACLQAGVMPIAFRPGKGFIIVQSISTWLDDVRYSKKEMSVRRTVDRLARAVRERLDDRIGEGVTPAYLNSLSGDVKAVLEDYAQRGYIVGDATHPPYQNISVSQQQSSPDTILVSFEASPGVPANYILVTAHLTAFGS